MSRPLQALNMTAAERATLESWARRPKTAQQLAHRARILLHCDRGLANDEVAKRTGTSKQAICKWRKRFRVMRLQGLSDASRSGPPRQISDNRVDEIVKKTLTSRPANATQRRWFAAHPRFELHFTPTSASWLNGVERFFAKITRRRIRRGTFTSVASLERAISDYLSIHNEQAKPFVWTATADTTFDKIVHHCSANS